MDPVVFVEPTAVVAPDPPPHAVDTNVKAIIRGISLSGFISPFLVLNPGLRRPGLSKPYAGHVTPNLREHERQVNV
ncbi:MAG: hypothetical protein WAM81_11990, partial [Acidimicrobiia bacterium]